ncbi:aminoglycoside phosphotransferase [Polymorphobacter glacialis]|uniref:Aminoglycoside phosphotransferase n=1 Tax=Sandarakinorhabdus glacialis TaxID=1614636 RepID=A0A916ZKZ6_9SPHN|nr:aminoglycoside phosphotransferase family protein [Polymorphobacter glacialis]GGE01670.1 aminoglycoside phosphotransferase [Polymorphobacter glacialis]
MIPVSPAEFGNDWLERVLKAPVGSLRGMSAAPVGTGQMCDSFRLTLDWDGHAGPATVIAKCPSHDEKSRYIAGVLGNYDKEVRWYRELAGMSAVSKPHCYHAEIADDGVTFALLLGDCAPAVQADQVAGAGAERLRPAIGELAALHAPFWNGDTAERHPWLAKDTRAMIEAALPALAEGFAERYQGRLAPDILALARALAANIGAYLNREASAWSVVHGDFRLDNLLYAPDGRVFVVDWQTVGIGCPFADVAYLVGTSVADPDERAAIEAGLFDDYVEALASHDVVLDAAARAAGWHDYRVNALAGVLMAIFASMNVERTVRGDEMFAVMAERPARQALALGSLELIDGKAH